VTAEADVLVAGSGFAGLLVARELVAAGRGVLVIERGELKPHAAQLADRDHEVRSAATEHTHEPVPRDPAYPWNYVQGVGGGSLHWTGAAPRLLPSDFRLRSEHGVGRDWPLDYAELEPFYVQAENLLQVAGADLSLFPRSAPLPQPAHALSPASRSARFPRRGRASRRPGAPRAAGTPTARSVPSTRGRRCSICSRTSGCSSIRGWSCGPAPPWRAWASPSAG
jgi:choline dehydrogenase-like flavoprotein